MPINIAANNIATARKKSIYRNYVQSKRSRALLSETPDNQVEIAV
jgi:hypothetical protein